MSNDNLFRNLGSNFSIFSKQAEELALELDDFQKKKMTIMSELSNKYVREMSEMHRKEEEYKQAVLNTLQGIENNTASLAEISVLIRENTEKQKEVYEIITEILAMNLIEQKKEADNTYRKVMKKITNLNSDVNTIQKLTSMANNIYNQIQTFL